ncbi:T9SS type A sorting domain-containing protein [Marinoscillum sp.]|uniref:T9SS type A sorting domain-containing protein n=1 Tax=Marinoscillum sp. TaxID=2024838 RepID=UPI003BAB275A
MIINLYFQITGKRLFATAYFFCLIFASSAQVPEFTWIGGSDAVSPVTVPNYGEKGITNSINMPGARQKSISWTDNTGNLWVFGGYGYDSLGTLGNLNDLWKWDGTNWTWVSGSNSVNSSGSYGIQGVASATNVPGARQGSISWFDTAGNFWLFGGNGYDATGAYSWLNDLWMWDGINWTWVSGSHTVNSSGNYGSKGIPNSTNIPGARESSVSWIDSSGDLWLFGGYGYDGAGSRSYLNDLWKWDGTNWTWISGNNSIDGFGDYGVKGTPSSTNLPGARNRAMSWIDDSNNLWLFGGYAYDASGSAGYINDLWKWDGTNWTWVSGSDSRNATGNYGVQGEVAASNVPGARVNGATWVDMEGNLYIIGGNGYDESFSAGYLNDLWKWDGINWTWISGNSSRNESGTYGEKGVKASTNALGGVHEVVTGVNAEGDLLVFGGYGFDDSGTPSYLNSLWKWDGTDWTWISGSSLINSAGIYGTKGVASEVNLPGARQFSLSWTDESGNLWLFGGQGYDGFGSSGSLNDLWKWDGTNWTWVSGSSSRNEYGTYGDKGVSASSNVPGSRHASISWMDDSGNLWFFGGQGYDGTGSFNRLNDLWKWDGTNWVWVSGNSSADQPGDYGDVGVSSATNVPGARLGSSSWTDDSGNLWLFGGFGRNDSGVGYLNDLWKWDGTNWTWISGSNSINQYGNYGDQGVAASTNMPGGHTGSMIWIDDTGNLWLFGGQGYGESGSGGHLNDLWKWDGTNWTWMSGSKSINTSGIYGSKGEAASANAPGAREHSLSWIDSSGNLWLFGGYGYDGFGSRSYLNDLWKWDGTNWIWISGSKTTSSPGIYETSGMTSSTPIPGARQGGILGKDNLLLFGGYGVDRLGRQGYLNDFFEISYNLPPIFLTTTSTVFIENSEEAVIDVDANNGDGGEVDTGVSYALSGGADQSLFNINTTTGVISFINAPDFENPLDNDTNNDYEIEISANDGVNVAVTRHITITVTNIVDEIAPTITSTSSISVLENQTGTIYTATANESVTFSLGSSKDESMFTLSTDELSFTTAPDYESPEDVDTDNSYLVDVIATDDAGNATTQEVTITVTDVDEIAPTITSTSSISVLENQTGTIYTATANESVTFSLGSSKDESMFTLSTDELSFTTAPDYESPEDVDTDNSYLVDVIATDDAGNATTQEVTITVTDVDEIAPTITSTSSISVLENQTGTIYTATANESVTFSLGSSKDESMFTLSTDELSFTTAPDYESPEDVDMDNSYLVDVIATDDAGNATTQEVTITVTDIDEIAPTITSTSSISVLENQTGTIYTATANESVTFSLGSSKDESMFTLSTDELSFTTAPDYESPEDVDMDNSYLVDVIATDDARNATTQEVTITVTDVDEIAPTITSTSSISVLENQTGTIYTATANESVTFSLGSSKDESMFTLSTDELSFTTAPDYESPEDVDTDNSYLVDVIATDDAGNATTQEVTITVTDVDEIAPTITSTSSISVLENQTGTIYTATANESVTFSLGSSKDESMFTLSTDELSFTTAPDYESPEDVDTDNSYLVDVIATDDAGNATTQEVTITVTDVDEIAPTITSTSSISVLENQTGTIYTATANESVTFSLGSSKDESMFTLSTDELSFTTAPDYESPEDVDTDNSYLVDVIATDDAGNATTQEVTITVTDVDEIAPTITSTSSISVLENQTGTIYTATANESVTFSLGSSKDESMFTLSTDELSFTTAPDYESPEDVDTDNSYLVDVIATDDAGNATTQEVTITVTDVDEIAPTITSTSSISVLENQTGTIYTATANESVTFSLGSSKDESMFTLSTDELSFTTAPDYESPEDVDMDNSYLVDVIATDDAGNATTQEVTITVTDIDEIAPTITSTSSISVLENQTGTIYTATANESVTFSLGSSKDESMFTLSTDELSFTTAPDYESPEDVDMDNSYLVDVIATDDVGNATTQEVTITVTDVDEEEALGIINNELLIHPNPSTGFISISNITIGSNFRIYNLQGKIVLIGYYTNDRIDISSLSSGTYFISYSQGERISRGKIIVK